MPFALVFIGLLLIVTGVKDTHLAFGRELVKDFTGPGNFFYWFVVIGALGALGSIDQMRAFSRMFLTLVLVAMVIRNGGVFDKLGKALKTGPIAPKRDANEGNTAANTNGVKNFQKMSLPSLDGNNSGEQARDRFRSVAENVTKKALLGIFV